MKKPLLIVSLAALALLVAFWKSSDEAPSSGAVDNLAHEPADHPNTLQRVARNDSAPQNLMQNSHIGAAEPIVTSNRPTHGEALLDVLKTERGGTMAVLQLQTSLVAHLKTETHPSADQLKALRDAEEMLPGLQEKLARQNAAIDRFDVNAGPPDESPESGAPVAVRTILNAEDNALAQALASRFNDTPAMKAEIKPLLVELNRNLGTVQVPEAMVPSVRNMLVNLVATSHSMADLPNRDLAAHTMAENKAAFVRAVQELGAGKRR